MKLLYFKEVLPIVSLLYRSAEKLGLDPGRALSPTGDFRDADLERFLDSYMREPADERSIANMGFVESEDQGGFRYKWAL